MNRGGMIAVLLLTANLALCTRQEQPTLAPATVRVAFVSPATSQPSLQDRAVIFHDDFEQAPVQNHQDARYFEYNGEGGSFTWSRGDGLGGHGGAMKCQFEKGQVSAGSLKVVFGKNPFGKGLRQQETFREIYWRVYVKHESGWEGNPAKLARATCLAT